MQDYKSIKRMLNEEAKKRIKQEKSYVINMTVNDDSSFLSEFSVNETPMINREFAELIENSTLLP